MLYDAYWARHDLANTFEVEKRTQLPRDGSKVIFEPGEIAYAPGGLKHAFYSFLQVSDTAFFLKKILLMDELICFLECWV
jgi:hypothetical protein